MTREEYRSAILDIVYLAACAVNEICPDHSRVAQMDLNALFEAAERHMLTGITAMALESVGVRDERFVQAKGKAIRKAAAFDIERASVLAELEEACIWYMPLKGSIIEEYYPRLGMRQMSDNDILYDASRSKDVCRIMERLGFKTVLYVQDKYSHDHYEKAPVCNFEMHRALFTPNADIKIFQYYLNVRERLVKDEINSYGYHFSPEDFYIFMIAHEYKHYTGGGTGIRSLLDTYVYIRNRGGILNWSYVFGEMDKLGLADFEARNRDLAMHLFVGKALTTEEAKMLDYILSSGTYGTTANRVNNGIKKQGTGAFAKMRYFLHRVFIPLSSVRASFPLFLKIPILLPFLPIYRLFRGLTVRRRQMQSEIKALIEYNEKP